MGPTDMRSLSFDQVWQPDTDRRSLQTDAKIKPKFAGEQQITSAILSLTQAKKPKVVFIRPGGAPLTNPGFPPFQPSGPLSKVADRLRDYNFDVLEKDLSGQYAMQAQMQGQPAPPEPTDQEIKDAVWIVLNIPTNSGQMEMPTQIGPKVAEHLKAGGSALILFLPNSENMTDALKDWGIDVRTDMMIVHEAIKSSAHSNDFIQEAAKSPAVFVINQYGDHLITKPLNSLDSVLLPMLPVLTAQKPGYTVTPLIPVPSSPKSWATHDTEAALNGDTVEFKKDSGDLDGPLFVGAASDNGHGGRVVAIGSLQFITNQMLTLPDQELAQRGIRVARFPGNAELFCNSVFWLSHMEPLIAISPSAMEVSRIGPVSDGMLRFWRVGILLIGIPLAVLACGVGVYVKRRD
jgi:hypothetical protein